MNRSSVNLKIGQQKVRKLKDKKKEQGSGASSICQTMSNDLTEYI